MTVITADDCPGASLRSRYVCQNHPDLATNGDFFMATDSGRGAFEKGVEKADGVSLGGDGTVRDEAIGHAAGTAAGRAS